jgi:hypothetical protein
VLFIKNKNSNNFLAPTPSLYVNFQLIFLRLLTCPYDYYKTKQLIYFKSYIGDLSVSYNRATSYIWDRFTGIPMSLLTLLSFIYFPMYIILCVVILSTFQRTFYWLIFSIRKSSDYVQICTQMKVHYSKVFLPLVYFIGRKL